MVLHLKCLVGTLGRGLDTGLEWGGIRLETGPGVISIWGVESTGPAQTCAEDQRRAWGDGRRICRENEERALRKEETQETLASGTQGKKRTQKVSRERPALTTLDSDYGAQRSKFKDALRKHQPRQNAGDATGPVNWFLPQIKGMGQGLAKKETFKRPNQMQCVVLDETNHLQKTSGESGISLVTRRC